MLSLSYLNNFEIYRVSLFLGIRGICSINLKKKGWDIIEIWS